MLANDTLLRYGNLLAGLFTRSTLFVAPPTLEMLSIGLGKTALVVLASTTAANRALVWRFNFATIPLQVIELEESVDPSKCYLERRLAEVHHCLI